MPSDKRAESSLVPGDRGGRARWRDLLVLMSLTGFAIADPLLHVFGQNPGLFSFYDIDGWDLVLYALIVAFVPPLVLWLVGTSAGLVRRLAGDVVFIVIVGVLAGAGVPSPSSESRT